jgi:hypothetical protein
MAFIADFENQRTYDPDRGIELQVVGGGAEGSTDFRLVSKSGICEFTAYREYRKPNSDDLTEYPQAKETKVWVINTHPNLPTFDSLSTKEIIRQAITAFGSGHGASTSNAISVRI